MTREQDVAELMLADVQLMGILTGGVYTDEELGIEGLRMGDDSPSANAFDVNGYLKPTAVVRQRSEAPYPGLFSHKDKMVSLAQLIEVFFFELTGHDNIDAAKQRSFELLQGARLSVGYPISFIGDSNYFYDIGSLYNAVGLRQDWQLVFIKKPSV